MTSDDILEQLFQQAQEARRQLCDAIAASAPAQAALFTLPKELQTRPLHRFDQIEPTASTGTIAHQQAVVALRDLTRRSDDTQSQRVRRYPGLLRFQQLPTLVPLCDQLSDAIDQFKLELHQRTNSATNKQDLRFELLHQLAPNLITMHFYRSPMVLTKQVSSIRLGWVAKRIVAKTDKDSILQRLHNGLTNPGKLIHDMPAWRSNVEREIIAIDSLPNSVALRIDRPGGLRPTAFIHFAEGGRTQTPANLPLLLNQQQPVELQPLPQWQQQQYPQAKGELLIPRLHLYRIN